MSGSLAESFDFGTLPSGTRERFILLFALALIGCEQITIYAVILISGYYPGQFYLYDWYLSAIIALFFLLVFASYAAHQKDVVKRFGPAGPLPPEMQPVCDQMLSKAGLRHVKIRMTSTLLQQDAIACGFPFSRTVILGGGLKLVFRKRPDMFSAIVAHELSHIKNRDVDIGYLSRAIFSALVLFTASILAFGMARFLFELFRNNPLGIAQDFLSYYVRGTQLQPAYNVIWVSNSLIAYLFEFAGLALILILAFINYTTLLRSREHYADLGGCFIVGSAALASVVGMASPMRKSLFRRLLAFHPLPQARLAVIADPPSLLVPSNWEVAFSGYVFGVITQNIYAGGFLHNTGTYTDYLKQAVSGWSSFFATALPLGLTLIFLLVLGSQNLRSSIAVGFERGAGFAPYLLRSAVAAFCMFASFAAGCILNTSFLSVKLFGNPENLYTVDILTFSTLVGATAIAAFVFGFYFRNLYPISSFRGLSASLRAIFLFLWLYLAVQLAQLIYALFAPDDAGLDVPRVPFALGLMVYIAIIFMLLALMMALARRRTRAGAVS